MHDLRLVTVTDDGAFVVLASADGERYRVRLDDQLRAAVRRDRPLLGQLQIQMESHVRPREIQARIRAGETAEDVASAAGVPVEMVRRFEGPVIAEREYVARQAQAVVPRRGEGRSRTLLDLVEERIDGRVVPADALEWDSWRREDGTWTVRLTYPVGRSVRIATWRFDTTRRTVVPEDDLAVEIVDGIEPPRGPRRLSAVRDDEERLDRRERVYDVEADGGLERGPLRARPRDEESPTGRRDTARQGDVAAARAGHEPRAGAEASSRGAAWSRHPAGGVDPALSTSEPAEPAELAVPTLRVHEGGRGSTGTDTVDAIEPGLDAAGEAASEAAAAEEEVPRDSASPESASPESAPAQTASPDSAPPAEAEAEAVAGAEADAAVEAATRESHSAETGPAENDGPAASAAQPDKAPRDEQPQDEPEPVAQEQQPAREAAAGGRRRSGRRASVPSWDDILLGTRRPE